MGAGWGRSEDGRQENLGEAGTTPRIKTRQHASANERACAGEQPTETYGRWGDRKAACSMKLACSHRLPAAVCTKLSDVCRTAGCIPTRLILELRQSLYLCARPRRLPCLTTFYAAKLVCYRHVSYIPPLHMRLKIPLPSPLHLQHRCCLRPLPSASAIPILCLLATTPLRQTMQPHRGTEP